MLRAIKKKIPAIVTHHYESGFMVLIADMFFTFSFAVVFLLIVIACTF